MIQARPPIRDKTMNNDPTRGDMIKALMAEYPLSDDFCEFDLEAAIYWFANDYHGGQWSNLYSALSTSPYRPSPLAHGIENESELAAEMYNFLVEKFSD